MSNQFAMVLVILVVLASLTYIIAVMLTGMRKEKKKGVFDDFSLGLSLMFLFLGTWVAQGVAQWQEFINDQHEHGQTVEMMAFLNEFMTSTLENWQSEFLQLFSFVALTAVLIHRGSAESKDSDEEMQRQLNRIERKLDEKS